MLLALIIFSPRSQAAFLLDVGGIYLSDDLTTSSTRQSSRMYYGLGAYFTLSKNVWAGWSYAGLAHGDDASTGKTEFTSMETGPAIKWQFGRGKVFTAGLGYNVLSRATFANGTRDENWEGTSFLAHVGVMPGFSDGWRVGVTLNYYAASYTKKTVNSVESSASNSKTWIFPLVSVTKEW